MLQKLSTIFNILRRGASRPDAAPLASLSLHTVAACSASLLVCITFHYVAERLTYLLDVVRALADFPVRLDAVILTNTADPSERSSISDLLAPLLIDGKSLEVLSCPGLAHPYDLAWSHKGLITERFLSRGSRHTHFIYLEDDTRFTTYREKLRAKGVIPSFVRVETNLADKKLYATDHLAPFTPEATPSVVVDGYRFCGVEYPYCGLYVLDLELAQEYVKSRSFQPESSVAMASEWPVRERAAMGLCWENPPDGFRTRYVIPVELKTGMLSSACWVSHLPNNYANDETTPYGKIAMNRLAEKGTPSRRTPAEI